MIYKNLPLKPLSINDAWQGRRFKSKDYNQFREDFGKVAVGSRMIEGFVRVDLVFTLTKENYSHSDVDNLIKPVLDAIVDRGYIEDDRKILELTARKQLGKDYAIELSISAL